ncbi:MAG: hypothetical protein K2K21_16030 [Lachnospiraceae bacterium]|nr:hypothetical protein [Lachnospiraceae bacterium]
MAAIVTIGVIGKDIVSAAENRQILVPRSYGRFVYDDGDASNNNGHEHDILIDAADFSDIAENINGLAGITDELVETAVRKNDVIDTLEEIKGNVETDKAAGANALKELFQVFQDGVNKIYDKLAGLGFTPITNSPDGINDAILNMYDSRYKEGKESAEITQNLKYYTWQLPDAEVPSRNENKGNGLTLTSPTAEEMFGPGYILIGVYSINAPVLNYGGIKGVNYSGFGTASGTVDVRFGTSSNVTETIAYTSIVIMGYKIY